MVRHLNGCLSKLVYHKVSSLVHYEIVSTVKLFANDTSLFSAVHDSNISVYELNNDMPKISEWA